MLQHWVSSDKYIMSGVTIQKSVHHCSQKHQKMEPTPDFIVING